MKSHAKVVVIGGGVVGCSVLFHLARHGWTDVVLLERDELTSGSTWHAAGGMHTINGDPNVAKLQKYTISLYKEIEELSGQATGVHLTGGVLLAATEARLDWLRGVVAKGRYLGIDLEVISPREAAELMPLLDPKQFVGAVRNKEDGHLDPSGVTHAYAKAARKLVPRSSASPRSRTLCGGPTGCGASSPTRVRWWPNMSSMPAACGRARSAAWSGSNCRCWPWSTCT